MKSVVVEFLAQIKRFLSLESLPLKKSSATVSKLRALERKKKRNAKIEKKAKEGGAVAECV